MSSGHNEPRAVIIGGHKRLFDNPEQLAVYRSNITTLYEAGEFMLEDPNVAANTLDTLSMISEVLNDVLHAEAAWLSELNTELEGQIARLHAQIRQADPSIDDEEAN